MLVPKNQCCYQYQYQATDEARETSKGIQQDCLIYLAPPYFNREDF